MATYLAEVVGSVGPRIGAWPCKLSPAFGKGQVADGQDEVVRVELAVHELAALRE